MAIYEYLCEANGRTVEVRHGMDETLRTWGDLAARAGVEPGDTPPAAPVRRLMSAGVPLMGGSSPAGGKSPEGPSCGSGCGCGWS